MTTSAQGGMWHIGVSGGMIGRNLTDAPGNYFSGGASRRRHWKMIKYYTDYHGVDEDMTTIARCGGMWVDTSEGIVYRTLDFAPTRTSDYVAYKDKNTILDDRMVFLMI